MYVYSDLFPRSSVCTVFKKMKLMIKRAFDKLQPVWQCSFYIDVDVQHFYYTYAVFYRKDRRVFIDRNRFREVVLSQVNPDSRSIPGKGVLYAKPQGYCKIDKKIEFEMNIQRLEASIWFGDYPQNSDDFRKLFDREVKVIVNLMTDDEANDSCLDVSSHKKEAQKLSMTYVRMPFDNTLPFTDRSDNLQQITFKLHQLMLKDEPIFLCEMHGVEKVREVLSDLFEEHRSTRSNTLKNHALFSNC